MAPFFRGILSRPTPLAMHYYKILQFDVEEISICDISLNTEDDELSEEPGPSRIVKQRKMR